MCLCFIKRVNPSFVAGTLKSRVEVGPLISVCFFLSSLSTSPNQATDSLTNLTPGPGVRLLQGIQMLHQPRLPDCKISHIFSIDQSILEGPIILNHWRLIHGIHLSLQELNFGGGSQTKRSEVLTNLGHVQSQIVSHGEAWDYSLNLPIVKMNFLVPLG